MTSSPVRELPTQQSQQQSGTTPLLFKKQKPPHQEQSDTLDTKCNVKYIYTQDTTIITLEKDKELVFIQLEDPDYINGIALTPQMAKNLHNVLGLLISKVETSST
jgi:hypothetical protein